MTILSCSMEPSPVIGLWVTLIILSGTGITIGVICNALMDYSKLIVPLVVLLVLGAVGFVFWTPRYNVVKVYANDKFFTSSIQDKYEIVDRDGYIITLKEKESIK